MKFVCVESFLSEANLETALNQKEDLQPGEFTLLHVFQQGENCLMVFVCHDPLEDIDSLVGQLQADADA